MTTYWRTVAVAVCAGALSCGTLAPEGGGAKDLPVSGSGPYRPLAHNEDSLISEPVVVSDSSASLDDPWALVRGEAIAMWYTRTDGKGVSQIRHVDFERLEDGPVTPEAFLAEQSWELGSVAQPSVIEPPVGSGQPWILFYAANGAIGYATSADGHDPWTRAPGPALVAEGAEGAKLSSPAAVQLGPGVIRLYYVAAGGVLAADADADALGRGEAHPFRRVEWGPIIPLGAAPWLPSIGRITARTVTTPAGRTRYDLFLSGRGDENLRVVGAAASWDGRAFAVAAEPFVDRKKPEEWSPAVIDYRAGAILFFTQGSVIAAAASP